MAGSASAGIDAAAPLIAKAEPSAKSGTWDTTHTYAVNGKKRTCALTRLKGANLTGALMGGANLTGADLLLADLREACLGCWEGSWAGGNPGCANLTGADLDWANLTNAFLARANLTNASLAYANLTGAYLGGSPFDPAGANLTGAVLFGANLTGAYVADVVWSDTACPNGTVTSTGCPT